MGICERLNCERLRGGMFVSFSSCDRRKLLFF